MILAVGSQTGDMCLPKIIFATTFSRKDTPESETSHSILACRTAKLSLFDGNFSSLVLGAITKPRDEDGRFMIEHQASSSCWDRMPNKH